MDLSCYEFDLNTHYIKEGVNYATTFPKKIPLHELETSNRHPMADIFKLWHSSHEIDKVKAFIGETWVLS